jgi:RNA polymerase sigma factor (sigma-70 family)
MCGVRLSAECVEDLVQDVLLRLWQFGVLEKLGMCPAYVRRVAERIVIDAIRRRSAQKRRGRSGPEEELSGNESRTPEELLLEREEVRLLVRRCRLSMSKRLFQTFALVYLAGLPGQEVRRVVGLSRPGLYTALYRIRRVLQEQVSGGEVGYGVH